MALNLHSALATAKNQLATDKTWLFLLKIELTVPDTQTLYLHRGTENLTFDGQTWEPVAFQIGEITQDSDGNLVSVDCSVFDMTGIIRKWMREYDFDGAPVTLRVLESGDFTDPTRSIDQSFTIRGWRGAYEQVTFQLGHQDFMKRNFPGRSFLRTRCSWVFRGTECAYSGSLSTCDRTLDGDDGCRAHSNEPRFGGAPAIPRSRNV